MTFFEQGLKDLGLTVIEPKPRQWGDCVLDLTDDGTVWVNEGQGEYGFYTFHSKDNTSTVSAEHIEGNRYAIHSCWT